MNIYSLINITSKTNSKSLPLRGRFGGGLILVCLCLLAGCKSGDSDIEALKAEYQQSKGEMIDITVPTKFTLEDDPVPEDEPVTPADSAYYNDFFEHLRPKASVTIEFNGNTAQVSGTVTEYQQNGAHVTVTTSKRTVFILKGETDNGSLTILPSEPLYRDYQERCGIFLRGVKLHNPEGAAINSQLKKRLLINVDAGTENFLSSGAPADGDYAAPKTYGKGCIFSENKIVFSSMINEEGAEGGKLTVTSSFRNCIAADKYIVIRPNVRLTLNAKEGNGIKAKDGIFIRGGQTTIFSSANTHINNVMVTPEHPNGVDTVSCACVKTDSVVVVNNGLLQMKASGDGAKGIKADCSFTQNGGTVHILTLGKKIIASPKGIKADTGITVNNGSFYTFSDHASATDSPTLTVKPAHTKTSHMVRTKN